MDIIFKDGREIMFWHGNDDLKYLIERNLISIPIITNFELNKTNGLDIGCGKRRTLPCAIGIDLIRGFSEPSAQTRYYVNPDIICPAEKLIFQDETIDWITASHVIEHFEDPITIINEWLRVLKPGGIISLIVPIAKFTGKIGEKDTDLNHKHDYDLYSFNEQVISNIKNIEIVQYKDCEIQWSFAVAIKKLKSTNEVVN